MSGKIIEKNISDEDFEKVVKHTVLFWHGKKTKEKNNWILQDGLRDLEYGLGILKISQDEFSIPWVTAEEISSLLVDIFSLPATVLGIKHAFAKAGGKNKNKKPAILKKANGKILYKISQSGEYHLKPFLGKGLLHVIYLKPDSHATAVKEIRDVVSKLKGKELKISDPYYGLNTLNTIEEIVRANKKVKFISYKSTESITKFNRELAYLQKHYPKMIEVRIFPKNELHDRYIIADDALVIVGHGIKDVGNGFLEEMAGSSLYSIIK
jgi:hypothetical protein